MSRFLFVVPPFTGHVNPTIGVALELERRGHEVAWAGVPGATEALLPPGATFLAAVPDEVAAYVAEAGERRDDARGAAGFKFLQEEVLLPLGTLDFGKGLRAKCDIGLWRTRGEHQPLVGEFAFQAKFDDKEKVAAKQKERAAAFYLALQRAVESWLALGVTKTAMVYRLNGAEPQRHE